MKKLLAISVLFGFFVFPLTTNALLTSPYVVDEKPQVLFSDSAILLGSQGLQNYFYNYVGGYLHITFTLTHDQCCYAGYPPFIHVTDIDPRTTVNVVSRGNNGDVFSLAGAPTDLYYFDVQFDSTGYNLLVKRSDQSEYLSNHADYTGMQDSDFAAFVNQYPSNPPSPYSMAFTPRPVRDFSVATGTSVMFFPGIMGTQLYDDEGRLWPSTTFSDYRQAELELNLNGQSVNHVYTKDDTQSVNDEQETGITDEIFDSNIYNSFINDLRVWKNTDHIITDYAFVPYDWRLSLDDIITKGATTTDGHLTYDNAQDFSQSYILKKLTELSEKSEKIVLIGHSNGGLVIKALMQKLKETNSPLLSKIDKIIFVAVPQVGTPDAFVNLLHGTDLGWHGFIMTNERSRGLSENMPFAYNLLPSAGYFSMINSGFAQDKVVSFENNSVYDPQISQYGLFISNVTEMKNFLLGTDGRIKPLFQDTLNPNIGNTTLYTQAAAVHSVLDSWQPASTTKVIQIAGWGEETLAGLDYQIENINIDSVHYEDKKISVRKIVDGDGTVVTPSALWMSTSTPNVERWWVDLWKFNDDNSPDRVHRSITEIEDVRNLIKDKITSHYVNYQYIKNDASDLSISDVRGNKLHYTLHSPLTLGVFDNQGRYTGLDPVTRLIREEIPSVKYEVFGNTQFISIPDDLVGQVKLSGYDNGVFSLDVEKQSGNEVIEKTSFQGIPSSTSTQVVMDIDKNVGSSTLQIDFDGNGIVDKNLKADASGELIYDNISPEISITFSTTTNDILFNGVDINPTTVSVSTSSVSILDSQDNKTILYFSKSKNGSDVRIKLKKVVRNSVETILPNIEIEFEISRNKLAEIKELESSVEVRDSEMLKLKYSFEKKTTLIKEKVGGSYVNTTRNGLVIEKIVTDKSGVKFVY